MWQFTAAFAALFVLLVVLIGRMPRRREGKIIYLISPPRSLSVALLRSFAARNDTVVMHEPSQRPYDLVHYPELTKDWFYENAPQTYAEVKKQILKLSQSKHVLVKEMSFAVRDFIINEPVLPGAHTYYIMLVRDPHAAAISFYKKSRIHVDSGVVEGFHDLLGYRQQWEIYVELLQRATHKPIILRTETLVKDPEKTLRYLCKRLRIPFQASSLSWNNLGADFEGTPWREAKKKDLFQHWHGEAIHSAGFGKPTTYEILNGEPTFAEIENLEDREKCREAYLSNLKYYKYLTEPLGPAGPKL